MGPAIVMVLLLAGLWLVFLVPPIISERRQSSLSSLDEFGRLRTRLNEVQGYRRAPAVTRTQIVRRRRMVLILLGVSAVTVLGYAIVTRSVTALFFHIFIDALIAWYVALLLQIRASQGVVPIVRPPEVPVEPVEGAVGDIRIIAG